VFDDQMFKMHQYQQLDDENKSRPLPVRDIMCSFTFLLIFSATQKIYISVFVDWGVRLTTSMVHWFSTHTVQCLHSDA